MWDGVFAPRVRKSGGMPGSHTSNPLITVGVPEYGSVQLYVEFNHVCQWNEQETLPPSNSKTYTFDYSLDEFTDGQYESAADLQLELDKVHEEGRSMEWLRDNIESGIVTTLVPFESNGKTLWI